MPKDEGYEGFSFLKEEDVNPDYTKDSETPETETEPEALEAADTDADPEQQEVSPEKEPDDQAEVIEKQQPTEYTVAGRTYSSDAEVIKALENANTKIAEQGQELGELRKQREPEVIEDELEYDPYDKDSVDSYVDMRMERKQQEITQKQAEIAKEQEQDKAMQGMINSFVSAHPELNQSALKEVASFGDERGIVYLEDAFVLWNHHKGQSQPSKPKAKDTQRKIKEADNVPETLSDGGGRSRGEIDAETLDRMTPDQLEQVPKNIREKWLTGDL